jgi:hypothetical protein
MEISEINQLYNVKFYTIVIIIIIIIIIIQIKSNYIIYKVLFLPGFRYIV